MFQLTFSDQSMQELNALDQKEQLVLVDQLSSLTDEILSSESDTIGRFNRGGVFFYRLRTGDFRCYFTKSGGFLACHCILHKNTLEDFVFRCKLPVKDEQLLEKDQSFWQYLEGLAKK
tara:strand:+ start:240 stop:593 length:354 start_codon:yes stop_codon:yes gene_type:complete